MMKQETRRYGRDHHHWFISPLNSQLQPKANMKDNERPQQLQHKKDHHQQVVGMMKKDNRRYGRHHHHWFIPPLDPPSKQKWMQWKINIQQQHQDTTKTIQQQYVAKMMKQENRLNGWHHHQWSIFPLSPTPKTKHMQGTTNYNNSNKHKTTTSSTTTTNTNKVQPQQPILITNNNKQNET